MVPRSRFSGISNDRETFAIVMSETFHRFGKRSLRPDGGKTIAHDIVGDDELGQVGRIEITFDVMQRNGADESSVVGHINIIDGTGDELFSNFRETCRRLKSRAD